MIKPNDIKFSVRSEKDKSKTITGSLNLFWVGRIGDINTSKLDLIEQTKDLIKRDLWDKCYRELITPICELEMMARYHDKQDMREKIKQILELLDLNKC